MSNTAIKVENLSKIYRLGEIGTGSMGQDVDRWFKTKILGKEDPFLKIGESNDRSKKGTSDIVYSLQDINFEIQQGDAVGIIGRNGAGKSTLLKILSRVTTPTTGRINIKGRVASLLEVGTGFHPELTGRENIYLNGAILGMRKREIDRKLDEIIDFSGVERYIDTPVKRYSSGMYVRLAFAVAAHLESEILIVDEVLAVGDAEFQKKCLGKMGEVSKGEGRTVLFVSHNMAAVRILCNIGILVEDGRVSNFDNINNILERHNKSNHLFYGLNENKKNDSLGLDKIELYKIGRISNNSILDFKINFISKLNYEEFSVELIIKDRYSTPLFFVPLAFINMEYIFESNLKELDIEVILPLLAAGSYIIDLLIVFPRKLTIFQKYNDVLAFEIEESNFSKELPWAFLQSRDQGSSLISNVKVNRKN